MKPIKLEFVIFKNASIINYQLATKLWSAIATLIEAFGYDVSGVVIELPEELDKPEVSVLDEQYYAFPQIIDDEIKKVCEEGK